jgi:outer membrane protein OmpA-like peptidoglycan-associated protein
MNPWYLRRKHKIEAGMNLKQTSLAAFLAGGAAFLLGSEAGVLPYSRGDGPEAEAFDQARADLAAATERTATLETELEAATDRVAELTSELDALETEVARLTADLVERDEALDAAATEAAGNVSEIARLNVMVAERDAAFEELETAIAAREIRIAELSAEMESRGIEVADAGDLPVPDLASVPLPDASKILGDEDATEVSLAALAPPDAATPATQMEIFEQALAAAKPMSPLPPAEAATPVASDARPAAVAAPGLPLVQVHFETGSARLTPGGRIRALAAATVLVESAPSAIRVTGHTDTTGSAAVNLELSRARAEAVADLFVEAGLPRDRIEIAPMGEEASVLPIPTGDGVSEPLNRCVGIFATL